MISAEQKIFEMIGSGKINRAEGDALLQALHEQALHEKALQKKLPLGWLVNPFERLSDTPALLLGVGAFALQIALPIFLRVRFDGVVDLHVAHTPLSLRSSAIQTLVSWLPALLFF